MPDDLTVKLLGSALLAALGLSSALVAYLKQRPPKPVGLDTDKLNNLIDDALDRVEDEVREQARLTAERLYRR